MLNRPNTRIRWAIFFLKKQKTLDMLMDKISEVKFWFTIDYFPCCLWVKKNSVSVQCSNVLEMLQMWFNPLLMPSSQIFGSVVLLRCFWPNQNQMQSEAKELKTFWNRRLQIILHTVHSRFKLCWWKLINKLRDCDLIVFCFFGCFFFNVIVVWSSLS